MEDGRATVTIFEYTLVTVFVTAIALSEHQSMVMAPGDPIPTLGEEQFETVARGFTQFDEREGHRNDNFMNAGNPPAPPMPPQSSYQRQTPNKNVMDLDSDDESDSDTKSDKDSDDELGQTKKAKSGTAGQKIPATPAPTVDDMDELRE
ncbi:aaa family atpase [Fusarium flagelliforme]|uniref:Aaa family atpase n=1 Tax=Fusarium flagelliforme TaxID=2675880 RepID=A0A395MVT1_9HYPO|nr:aaa family atpase [Fusarium flagelliforme]